MKNEKRPKKNVAESVREFARPVVEGLGLELWDVAFEKVGGQYSLIIYIDSENGVKIEDCEAVSRAVDPLLDRYDPIEQSYTFSVSSAGLERALTRQEHFDKFTGSTVAVSLFRAENGQKKHEGTLRERTGEYLEIESDGLILRFDNANVAAVRLVYTGEF